MQFRPKTPFGSIKTKVIVWNLCILFLYFAGHGSMFLMHSLENDTLQSTYGAIADPVSSTISLQFKLTTIAVLGVCCVMSLMRVRGIVATLLSNRVILALTVLPLLSVVWSEDPWRTLIASIYLAVTMIFAIYLATIFAASELREVLVLFGWITIVLSTVLAIAFPSIGIDGKEGVQAWQGIFVTKNSAAVCMAFLFSAGLLRPTKGTLAKLLNIAYLLACIVFVILTQSRTGWILLATCVPFALLTRLTGRLAAREQSIFGVFAMVVILASLIIGLEYGPTLLVFMGKDPTLTGRMPLWSVVMSTIWRHPVFGYGFHAFWNGLTSESRNVQLTVGWAVPHSHNGFLDVWLDLGGIGLALVVWSFVQGAKNGLACIRMGLDPDAEWYVSIVFITLMCNLDERTIMYPQFLEWILYVIACVGLAEKARQSQTKATDVSTRSAFMQSGSSLTIESGVTSFALDVSDGRVRPHSRAGIA